MKTHFFLKPHHIAHLCLAALLVLAACHDDGLPPEIVTEPAEAPEAEQPDSWHDKIRVEPYPKANNELYLNPPPLIVPEAMHTDTYVQIALADNEAFDAEQGEAYLAEPVKWNMYNHHRALAPGTWYWRFRDVSADGTPGDWGQTYSFTVTDDLPVFVTPPFEKFFPNIPRTYPRLYCYLDKKRDAMTKEQIESSREYPFLIGRAETAYKYDLSIYDDPYLFDNTEGIKALVNRQYQAYYLTGIAKYQEGIVRIARLLLSKLPISDKQLFQSNFGATNIAIAYAESYDIAYDLLTPAERQAAEEVLMRVARHYYKMYCGMQENRFFDNHFWQHNMRILFQIALVLYTHPLYADECAEMLEFYYELWTSRAPNGGFNHNGAWMNGVGYFTANVKTLYYIPSLFSALTGSDFLAHPWFKNAGRAMSYVFAPGCVTSSFGDGSEGTSPDRQRLAFADFLARETGDAYAAWYATQCDRDLITDLDMRVYRIVTPRNYDGSRLPENTPKLLWHKDVGELTVHSNLGNIDKDFALAFRSSTFGSNSHTHGDQNAFKLLYGGEFVFRNGGHFVGAANQKYNLLFYKHSRGHNTILVNGIGQAYSMKTYGQILRGMGGNHMAYCLGDASQAYGGITDEKSWVSTFEFYGIEQTPENGFGETPLSKYRRHILLIYPRTMLIYDDLEATEPVRWDWLLHSPTQFFINEKENTFTTRCAEKDFHTVVRQFSDHEFETMQTTKTPYPISDKPDPKHPDLWHLTSAFKPCAANRILSIIQVCEGDEQPAYIKREGNTFYYGDYTIEAMLDSTQPAELNVSSSTGRAQFSYSKESPVLDGVVYPRMYSHSSLLYDETDGEYKVTEQVDYKNICTRTSY